MTHNARATRDMSLLAIGSLVAAIIGWASVEAGANVPYGTAYATERAVGGVAAVVGVALAIGLLKFVAGNRRSLQPPAMGLALAVAAVPLAVPAMWALGYPLNTPAADSFGCGTVTTPQVPGIAPGTPAEVADSCRTRLTQQRVLVGILALPPFVLLGLGLVQVVRQSEPQEDDDHAVVIHK